MLAPGSRHRHARAELSDARSRRDPTRTYFIRARMRSEGDRRWRALAQSLREALIKHDLVGMRGVGRIPHGDKTEGFAAWLREEILHKVLGYDGGWLLPYVRRAADVAQQRASALAPGGRVDPRRVASMESLAVSELRGVAEAAQQQITRVVTHCLMANASPTQTANGVSGVVRVMRQRTRAMAEYVVAKTHATSTLSAFRGVGVRRVGVEPERVSRRRVARDARPIEEDPEYDEVDVLTAGDDDVCVVCQDISEEGPYELDEAEDLIPAHPWCRCAFVPAGTLGDAATRDALEGFQEEKHPRDPKGKFAEGGEHFERNWQKSGSVGGHSQPTPETVQKYEQAYLRQPTGKLDPGQMGKVGAQLGSNKGGVYVNKAGKKFYVKEPKSEAHVTNEKVAAALYKLAGARTLEYVDAGPKHVATKFETLGKNNTSQLNQEERQQAQRDFAVHAWTANWDAAGLTGDNQGVVTRGEGAGARTHTVTLDVGGALEYRAQGAPKGAAFGTKVNEVDTLRNPAINSAAAKLFGDMTHEQIEASTKHLAEAMTPKQITETVLGAGGSRELADKMVARYDDIITRVQLEQYKVPPVGSHAEQVVPTHPPPPEPAKPAPPQNLAGTHPEIHAALIAKTKGNSAERVALRKMLKSPGTPHEVRKSIQSKILTSFQIHHQSLVKKGNAEKAAQIEGKLNKYASQYGMTQYKVVAATEKEANFGFSKQDVAGAKEVMGGKSYSPEEVKSFNDLVALVGTSSAKSFMAGGASKAKYSGLPITGPEAAHIYAYTTSSTYHETNKLLRESKGENLPLKYQNHVNALNDALTKLPDYRADVWRKISVSDSTVEKYKAAVGQVVTEHQFSSAAKDSGHWHGNVWFQIKSRTGKDISKLSAHGSEAEVLFRAGTSFKITGYQPPTKSGGRHTFTMEEAS